MKTKCVLCKKQVEGFGHNPEPLASGRCCDLCNSMLVIPARMRQYLGGNNQNQKQKENESER